MINSLETLIYSFLCGKKVGVDSVGNIFFVHKKKVEKNGFYTRPRLTQH